MLNENLIALTEPSRDALLAYLREQDIDPSLVDASKTLRYNPQTQKVTGHTFIRNKDDTAFLRDDKNKPVSVPFTNPTTSPPPVLEYVNG